MSEELCLSEPLDPDTSIVLDDGLADYNDAPYVMFPDASSRSPFPPWTFEPVNYGDAYILPQDLTLATGTSYWFTRPLSVPEG